MKNEVIRILRSHLIEIRSLYSKYIREDEIDEIADEICGVFVKSPFHVSLCASCMKQVRQCVCSRTDWAGLDPVKFKDVGKRKYTIFGDSEDTNITP